MAHILAKLRGVPIETIGTVLHKDAPHHAEQGLYLEHLWQNADNADEVLFLFRTTDLARARYFIDTIHAQAKSQDPTVNLPHMTYLEDSREPG